MSSGIFPTTTSTSRNMRHAPTNLALPIQVPSLKCDTCAQNDATALCIGCYGSFCFDCFIKHRKKISEDFGKLIYNHDLFVTLFEVNSSSASATTATESTKKLDPLRVLAEIDSWEEDLRTKLERMANEARQYVKARVDDRYDEIFRSYPAIKQNLRTKEEAKRHIEATLPTIKKNLCEINDTIESLPGTMSLNFQSEEIDLKKAAKVISTRNPSGTSGVNRRAITTGTMKMKASLNFNNLGQPPFKKIERLGGGMAIGASDKFIVYRNDNDLCMIELTKEYCIAIPLKGVNDICWCAEFDYFVILTEKQVFTFDPNTRELYHISEIKLSTKGEFWRCTYAGNTNTLLLCYWSRGGSPIEEWKLSSPARTKLWQVPQSCEETEIIQCMRVSLNGSCVALTINNGEQDYFILRDRDMKQIHQIPLRITDCFSFVSLPNSTWLLSILGYHKLFLIASNYNLSKIQQTDPDKASTRGIAMLGDNIVAERTASTICFFKL
ncbi:unnamed protein product [Rotaria magnacalcarata]|uniref:Uncharacterized protein n=2 Tax=Rotaria magnacalcarata TaxID=392030 RepID=A0A817A483_9BILA|nr:unnamed protein product [Rotaria magnacalcarata]